MNLTRLKRILKQNLVYVKDYVTSKPILKSVLIKILNNFPSLKYRLKVLQMNPKDSSAPYFVEDIEKLPPRAREIYNELLLRQEKVNE